MNASGTSLVRASLPFLFVGWLTSIAVFIVSDSVVSKTAVVFDALREEAFRGRGVKDVRENVAVMDNFNRLYHAREMDLSSKQLRDLTILEHDWQNRPTKSLYASRAVWTDHGWLLLYGTIYRVGPRGILQGDPEPFTERLTSYPVTLDSFNQAEARPETMRYGKLRLLVRRLQQTGFVKVRRYIVELAAKLTFPIINLVVCLIGFAGSTRPQLRGHLRGLGMSLGWGMIYYLAVAASIGIAKQWPVPILPTVWAPHVIATVWCFLILQRSSGISLFSGRTFRRKNTPRHASVSI